MALRAQAGTAGKTEAQPSHEGRHPVSRDPAPLEGLLALQSAVGNQSMMRLVNGALLQTRLRISHPSDPYEREADRVAESVMRMPEPNPFEGEAILNTASLGLQRKCCTACAEEEEKLQRKPATAGASHNSTIPAALGNRVEAARGGGKPLPESMRSFFEPRFGRDFSRVRLHVDGEANVLARSLGARAYTVGNDIAFAAGQFAPDKQEGRRLLAHELVHVAQQGHTEALQRSPAALPISKLSTSTISRKVNVEEAAAELAEQGRKPKDLPPDVTGEIGREALRTLGYERIMELAEQAELVKSTEEAPAEGTIHRTPDPVMVWRDAATAVAVFGREFTKFAIAAGATSQVTPIVPGPDDAVAVGILVVGLFVAGYVAVTSTSSAPAPSIPTPSPAPPVSIPVPAPPTAIPAPVAPPVPVAPTMPRDTTQQRAEPRAIPRVIPRTTSQSCATQHPNQLLCNSLPPRYIYSSPQRAFNELTRGQKGFRLEKGRTATRGPCPGQGMHYGIRRGGEYVASIVCCPCCVDTPSGPSLRNLCGIV